MPTESYPEGFNAMGLPVPAIRMARAYATLKSMLPDLGTEEAMTMIGKAAELVEQDDPFSFGLSVVRPDDILAGLDVTGRYRLLATLCAG
jgi:hypothetical protein